ncbi:hypothetical protein AVEN_117184-1 [Araneus ventricosus]|uniref:Uncharacterized protein n=1 Tax=Araneus ventricosus TaxID=182803 RepID=A0A4Y2AWI1_ARAVE|nr:hypothetical protein AVEN_117184-1 [Araneus ventricosus]
MGLICKPYTANIESNNISYCQRFIRSLFCLSYNSNCYGLVTMDPKRKQFSSVPQYSVRAALLQSGFRCDSSDQFPLIKLNNCRNFRDIFSNNCKLSGVNISLYISHAVCLLKFVEKLAKGFRTRLFRNFKPESKAAPCRHRTVT